jgi:signal transduction histidine kinase
MSGHEKCIVGANELLHDVFANLLNNAVKYTGARKEIVVNLDVVEDDGGRYCQVTVEDDGRGIPDDLKERVFNRMNNGTARGVGLGLYLVTTLVDSYGGRVWVEDRVQGDHAQGARFVAILPAI